MSRRSSSRSRHARFSSRVAAWAHSPTTRARPPATERRSEQRTNPAAINRNRLTGDVCGLLGREKRRKRGEFVGFAEATHWDLRFYPTRHVVDAHAFTSRSSGVQLLDALRASVTGE